MSNKDDVLHEQISPQHSYIWIGSHCVWPSKLIQTTLPLTRQKNSLELCSIGLILSNIASYV